MYCLWDTKILMRGGGRIHCTVSGTRRYSREEEAGYIVLSLGHEDTHERRRQDTLYCLWDTKILMRGGGRIHCTVSGTRRYSREEEAGYTVLSLGHEDTHERRRQHTLYCLWDTKILMRGGGRIHCTVSGTRRYS